MFSDVLLLKVQAINNQHVQCCCSTHKEKEFNVWKFEKFPVAFLLEKVFFAKKLTAACSCTLCKAGWLDIVAK